MEKNWKSSVKIFILISFLFSWPIMFMIDGFLIHKLIANEKRAIALIILLVGHGLAMFGPMIASVLVQRKYLNKKYVFWTWGSIKNYIYIFLFFLISWIIPGVIGVLMGKFSFELNVENYYYTYMIIYLFIVPFSGIGEEYGWSGFLLSYLPQFIGRTKAIILSGAIRGLWHLPVLIGPYIYAYVNGSKSLIVLILMFIVFAIQLTISNIFLGAAFSYVWFKTKSIPLVGWFHFVVDLMRDFLTIIIIGYASSTVAMLFAQIPLLMIGSVFLEKTRKNEKINLKQNFVKK